MTTTTVCAGSGTAAAPVPGAPLPWPADGDAGWPADGDAGWPAGLPADPVPEPPQAASASSSATPTAVAAARPEPDSPRVRMRSIDCEYLPSRTCAANQCRPRSRLPRSPRRGASGRAAEADAVACAGAADFMIAKTFESE